MTTTDDREHVRRDLLALAGWRVTPVTDDDREYFELYNPNGRYVSVGHEREWSDPTEEECWAVAPALTVDWLLGLLPARRYSVTMFASEETLDGNINVGVDIKAWVRTVYYGVDKLPNNATNEQIRQAQLDTLASAVRDVLRGEAARNGNP